MKNFIILAIVFVISGCTTVTSGWGNAHYSVVANVVQSETGVVGSVVMANSSFLVQVMLCEIQKEMLLFLPLKMKALHQKKLVKQVLLFCLDL